MSAMRVGIVGVGTISAQYLAELPRFAHLELAAVADLDTARAEQVAREQGVRALTVDELLADEGVDVVLNLTIPAAHADIALRALAAGKHVYGEKPLALAVDEGQRMLAAARTAGRELGSAPDTVLGTGVQTARALLDAGEIGAPVAAQAAWSSPGHERWHPAPDFYYREGAGPLFDMGPYYLTALVTLLGPVARVTGGAVRSDRAREIATGPAAGRALEVDVATHVTALLVHASGVVSTVTTSFDVWATRTPLLEVYGTAGTLAVPDPNRFSDPVELARAEGGFERMPDSGGYVEAGRGVGLDELAAAVAAGRPPRASGELALHVLEIMQGALETARTGGSLEPTTRPERPDAVPLTRLG